MQGMSALWDFNTCDDKHTETRRYKSHKKAQGDLENKMRMERLMFEN